EPHGVWLREVVGNGDVVWDVRKFLVLGREPEAMAAADFPLALAVAAELLVVIFQNILTMRRAVGENARADIEADDQLGLFVREKEIVFPAAVTGLFDQHRVSRQLP